MGAAVGGLLGGGGIGAILNVASSIFPVGQLLNSATNMLTQGIGQAIGGAMQQLSQSFGMPKFVGEMVKNMAEQVLGGMQKPSNPGCDQHVGNKIGDFMKDFVKDLTDKIVESARKHMEQEGCGGPKGGKGGKGGKEATPTAGSWLEAIAVAMGSIAGDKAAKMVELSKKMSDLNSEGADLSKQAEGAGKDDKQGIQDKQQENARAFSITQSQFQAASQEFSILQNTFSNAIKSIGEGLTTMGRKG